MSIIRHTYARSAGALLTAAGLACVLVGCGSTTASSTEEAQQSTAASTTTETTTKQGTTKSSTDTKATTSSDGGSDKTTDVANLTTDGVIDTTKLFTERDLRQEAETSGATKLTVASGKDTTIDAEGVYVVSGEATDARIIVDVADTDKVQIVLDGVSITNETTPAIYVKSADKVWVTTAKGSTNTLTVTGEFATDGDVNCDAAIFSRDDLVLNGQGTLKLTSSDNGVTSKDDLRVTGGSYEIDATGDAIEANESIAISDGTFALTTKKDALHAENDEDDTQGFIYLCGGTYTIKADDDGIQATTQLQIDGGTYNIEALEGLEATYVQINKGSISIKASDDGINATTKSSSVGTPAIEIRGGEVAVDMGQGDTDALDANGNLTISGGTVTINAQSPFDYDGQGSLTGGTVTVNGEQVSELTNAMMGAGPMGDQMGAEGGRPMGDQMGGGPMGERPEGFGGGRQQQQQQQTQTQTQTQTQA